MDITLNFTEAERKKIDEFAANGCENMSADDVALYARWISETSAARAIIDANMVELNTIAEQRVEDAEQAFVNAQSVFIAMYNQAIERLEQVNVNG